MFFTMNYSKLMGEGIPAVVADYRGRIEWVNNSFLKLTGYNKAELIGKQVEMLMPDSYKTKHKKIYKSYAESNRVEPTGMARTLPLLKADGTEISLIIRLSEVKPFLRGKKIVSIFIKKI